MSARTGSAATSAPGLPVRVGGRSAGQNHGELSYLTQLAKCLTVQPDIQYVVHPNTDPALAHALVGQVRLEIAL